MRRRRLMASLFGIIAIAAVALGATVISGRTPLLGLDLKGGVEVVLAPQHKVKNTILQQAVDIIDSRVNSLGVANSSVQRQGNDVVVALPGAKNSLSALNTVGATAQLYFRPVYCTVPAQVRSTAPAGSSGAGTTGSPSTGTKASTGTKGSAAGAAPSASLTALTASSKGTASSKVTASSKGTASSTGTTSSTGGTAGAAASASSTTAPASGTSTGSATGTLPPTGQLTASACGSQAALSHRATTGVNSDLPGQSVILRPSANNPLPNGERWLLGPSTGQAGDPAPLSGTIVRSAVAEVTQQGAYVVNVTLTSSGLTRFNKVAALRNATYSASNPPFSSLEAIELDGVVESAPAIENPTFSGPVQITGSFTSKQASDLALQLNYGSLPVSFKHLSVQTVSATIGTASLKAGLLAGIGGILLVLLYMVAYYRALGLVVVLGLGVGGAILYAVLTELSYTASLALTLSGVTGIIVSVGITVDSYVVYFERLKDEIRSGKTVRASVERGFQLAFRTVLTADLVSFMAALILYLFTVGDVRGFAFTLGLSTLLDVFTAFFFIRPIVILLGQRRSRSAGGVLGIGRGLGVGQRVAEGATR